MHFKKYCALILFVYFQVVFSQEGIPVYSDYLSDNLYLVHPSMAGAAKSNTIRVTARKQWFDVDNSPSLQSANTNFRIGEQTGIGAILFLDQNGRFSQTGVYLSFAYHLLFGRDRSDLNMLSFGISPLFIQSNLNLVGLEDPFDPDPVVLDRVQKDGYFNIDFGISYHLYEFFAHITAKNILPTTRDIFNNNTPIQEFNNQRKYLISLGYLSTIAYSAWSIEPSLMYQVSDETNARLLDMNAKVYYDFLNLILWGGISYRRAFETPEFVSSTTPISDQNMQFVTTILGLNYKNWMFGYTYSQQLNSVVISKSGFHQITLGYDYGKIKERWKCKCPAVNK